MHVAWLYFIYLWPLSVPGLREGQTCPSLQVLPLCQDIPLHQAFLFLRENLGNQAAPGVLVKWEHEVLGKYFICYLFFRGWEVDRVSLCHPGWSAVARSRLIATSASQGSTDFRASASQVAGIIVMCHHTQLIFIFLLQTVFCHVGQAGLKLLSLKWSTRLGLPKCWDYRCEPLCLALGKHFTG